MKNKEVKKPIKLFLGVIAVLYPLLVFFSLVVFKLPVRYLSVLIIVFATIYFLVTGWHYKGGKHSVLTYITPVILLCIGVVCTVTKSRLVLKMYPALADFAYLMICATSLFIPPPIVFYFVDIIDKTIKEAFRREQFEQKCRVATIIWCVFFVIDGLIAVITTFFIADEVVWGIYNGAITYVGMALIFAGEYIVLKRAAKKEILNRADAENAPPLIGGNNSNEHQ
ncbi:MAG: hypothetical protein LBS86_06930 [Treponema sp.]|jgi:uncharacterized membrane protein|nr:hypothetical protein [Treponema sp.]